MTSQFKYTDKITGQECSILDVDFENEGTAREAMIISVKLADGVVVSRNIKQLTRIEPQCGEPVASPAERRERMPNKYVLEVEPTDEEVETETQKRVQFIEEMFKRAATPEEKAAARRRAKQGDPWGKTKAAAKLNVGGKKA